VQINDLGDSISVRAENEIAIYKGDCLHRVIECSDERPLVFLAAGGSVAAVLFVTERGPDPPHNWLLGSGKENNYWLH
jgi:hypothetical protein